ncbi:protein RGF1 INDUCIBLE TRANSCRIPTION FACTOR 1-like [Actinidia eriantha]|uniref:protein RGF1 INDUCIBLE TRANSCRIPTION FACTOR 1-like n=1 Tax=Actinidia eriantha TaxID=165200 RepID=UPI00258DFC9C|nr:protein RGF1 INDUCIBLE TRANSCRIPTION FACTOR 1-like [Actinidia eriantha]
MYNTVYFAMCIAHPTAKKNELDRFCIDCLLALCSHCLPAHARHTCIKIRRYVYCEVINRQDICKLFNCSGIQAYHTNKTKVLFLKQRPQQQNPQQQNPQHNSRDQSCLICQRSLQDASAVYCSIACKVSGIYGGNHKEETIHDLANLREKNGSFKSKKGYQDHEDLPHTKTKRQKVRKGAPRRAPMF